MLPLVRENRRLLVKHERSLQAVDPALLRVLGDLAEGRAAWPLLIFGDCGTGKTSAALALADIVETASYHTAEGLASFVMNRGGNESDAEFDRIGGKHLAILDELGTRLNVGDLAYSVIKRFADVRELEAHRVAIYVSNVTAEKLGELYDDRIYSRITGGTVFELTGPDRREAR